jgi:hypothetical protein
MTNKQFTSKLTAAGANAAQITFINSVIGESSTDQDEFLQAVADSDLKSAIDNLEPIVEIKDNPPITSAAMFTVTGLVDSVYLSKGYGTTNIATGLNTSEGNATTNRVMNEEKTRYRITLVMPVGMSYSNGKTIEGTNGQETISVLATYKQYHRFMEGYSITDPSEIEDKIVTVSGRIGIVGKAYNAAGDTFSNAGLFVDEIEINKSAYMRRKLGFAEPPPVAAPFDPRTMFASMFTQPAVTPITQ